jgi:thiosulfate dehydrogenase
MRSSGLWLAAVFLIMTACGPEPAAERGRSLADDPKLSLSPSNSFACTTCHATTDKEQSERILPGHPLLGVAARQGYWGGGHTYLLDAVNQCLVDFMRSERLTEDDANGLALLAYLQALSPSFTGGTRRDPALPCTVIKNIEDTYLSSLPAGDAGRGASSYERACGYCHGELHSGDGRLGTRVTILPDDTIRGFGAQARAVMAEKVRHGRYFSIGGNMPFYCTEVLSDADLSDIVSYLLQ